MWEWLHAYVIHTVKEDKEEYMREGCELVLLVLTTKL
jgi:hypothetical protein